MELHKTVASVFYIVGAVLLAMLLYQLFFGTTNSALSFACNSVETPISFYYYEYAYYPSVHSLDGVSQSLGLTINDKVSDLQASSSTDKDTNTDNASAKALYSTDWQ